MSLQCEYEEFSSLCEVALNTENYQVVFGSPKTLNIKNNLNTKDYGKL